MPVKTQTHELYDELMDRLGEMLVREVPPPIPNDDDTDPVCWTQYTPVSHEEVKHLSLREQLEVWSFVNNLDKERSAWLDNVRKGIAGAVPN